MRHQTQPPIRAQIGYLWWILWSNRTRRSDCNSIHRHECLEIQRYCKHYPHRQPTTYWRIFIRVSKNRMGLHLKWNEMLAQNRFCDFPIPIYGIACHLNYKAKWFRCTYFSFQSAEYASQGQSRVLANTYIHTRHSPSPHILLAASSYDVCNDVFRGVRYINSLLAARSVDEQADVRWFYVDMTIFIFAHNFISIFCLIPYIRGVVELIWCARAFISICLTLCTLCFDQFQQKHSVRRDFFSLIYSIFAAFSFVHII